MAVERYCPYCDIQVPVESAVILNCRTHLLHPNCNQQLLAYSGIELSGSSSNGPADCPICEKLPYRLGCPFHCAAVDSSGKSLQSLHSRWICDGALSVNSRRRIRAEKRVIRRHVHRKHATFACKLCGARIFRQFLLQHRSRCCARKLQRCPVEGCKANIDSTLAKSALKTPSRLLHSSGHRCPMLRRCEFCGKAFLGDYDLLAHSKICNAIANTTSHNASSRPIRNCTSHAQIRTALFARLENLHDSQDSDSSDENIEDDGTIDPRSQLRWS